MRLLPSILTERFAASVIPKSERQSAAYFYAETAAVSGCEADSLDLQVRRALGGATWCAGHGLSFDAVNKMFPKRWKLTERRQEKYLRMYLTTEPVRRGQEGKRGDHVSRSR